MKATIKKIENLTNNLEDFLPEMLGFSSLLREVLVSQLFWLENAMARFLGLPFKNSTITIVSVLSRLVFRRVSVNGRHLKFRASDTPLAPGLQDVFQV